MRVGGGDSRAVRGLSLGHQARCHLGDGAWTRRAVGSPQVVLSRDYHLSYPFVFSWRGEQFMVPESADAGRVELYRALRAPMEWTLETMLMADLPLADCTMAEIDGKWWMFANGAVPGASFWMNSTCFTRRHQRDRGHPIAEIRSCPMYGRLARRAHCSSAVASGTAPPGLSRSYGYALNIQRIRRIDESTYEEETEGRLFPEWAPGLTGVHTVNARGGLTVIDARRRISKAPWGSSG